MADGNITFSLTGIVLGIFLIMVLAVPIVMIPLHVKNILKSGNLKGIDLPITLGVSLVMWLGFLFPAVLFFLSTLNSFGLPIFDAR